MDAGRRERAAGVTGKFRMYMISNEKSNEQHLMSMSIGMILACDVVDERGGRACSYELNRAARGSPDGEDEVHYALVPPIYDHDGR